MPVNPQAHVACAINIHPVLRVYVNGAHLETLHLKVTLDGHWTTPDVRLALHHFLNRHLHIDAQEPDASKPFDFYRTPEAQREAVMAKAGDETIATATTTAAPLVSPETNAEFLVMSKGAIVSAAFDGHRPCSLPMGAARLDVLAAK